jgi:hypothetical protein
VALVAHIPDIAVVDQARKKLGLSLSQLWISYFTIGGKADRIEFEAFFHGVMRPDPLEYNVLAHAVNEHFMDRGEEQRVAYAGYAEGS